MISINFQFVGRKIIFLTNKLCKECHSILLSAISKSGQAFNITIYALLINTIAGLVKCTKYKT